MWSRVWVSSWWTFHILSTLLYALNPQFVGFSCTWLSWTISSTNLPDMTSLAASRRLQNAIKYCTKVRKTGVASNESNNLVIVERSRITTFYTDICANLLFSHTEYDVISCFMPAFIAVRKKRLKMLSPTPLSRILVAWRFACPTNWWASCLLSTLTHLTLNSISLNAMPFQVLSVPGISHPSWVKVKLSLLCTNTWTRHITHTQGPSVFEWLVSCWS